MASPQNKECPSGVVLNTISKGASPESKCPICLDHFKNISYLDVCLHKFCFCCIHEWSKNKAECPLCKQPFNSIYHTIKSEDNYKKYDLRPTENGSFGNIAGQRFRYRTTLIGDRRPASRRTSPPPDHGIIFEGLRGSIPQRHNRDLHSMIRRLAVRRRRESEGRSVQSLHEQEVVKFRRALYRRGARVQSVWDGGRSRETSAEFFRRNPACLHRLVPWLRRELAVLYGAHGSLVNIVQHIIMTLITRHNLDDQAVLHELRPFLLTHTEHFLHEFLSFARSPFNMEAYDQRAVYDLPQPSGESSNSDTSVIAISEDESDSLLSGAQDYATPRVVLSQTAWDDETPGPSYSLEPSLVLPVHVRDSDSDSSVGEAVVSAAAVSHHDQSADIAATATIAVEEEHSSESDEECVIVGFVKPVAERTPELVQLSSDSELSEPSADLQIPRAPQHIRFISDSDLSPTVTQRALRSSSRSPEGTTAQLRKNDRCKTHHERESLRSREGSSRHNRTQSSSYSRKQPLFKVNKHRRRGEKETCHQTSSYSHSYSHYSQHDSDRNGFTETHSSYTSYYRTVYDRPRSGIHGTRQSRNHEDRHRSRSNSRVNCSTRRNRSHSRSNSRINQSRQIRSHSRSNSRINSSTHRNRSHSRNNSRSNSSSRRIRSHSRSNSRINSSSRQIRSHSRSNSRINSSNRRIRSHSRSNSKINSSTHYNRSHSRNNSRSNSSSRRIRSHSRSYSRINSSSRRIRSHSRSNSRINSSSRRIRSHSRSNSRINSSSRSNRRRSRSSSRNSSCQTPWHDEYGRKRKYKTKHNEESSRKSSNKFESDSGKDGLKKKSKKHHKKFKRKSRSPSMDDKSEGHSRKHPKKKKKKHKRKSKRHKSKEREEIHSPVLITITSDSDSADSCQPSTSNICAVSSTVTIANSTSETQPMKSCFPCMEQPSASEKDLLSMGDAGNHLQTE